MPEEWQPTSELELEGARLTRLMYEQPQSVVDTVRQLPVDTDLERFVVANVLVDGGREAADHAAVREGVNRLEKLRVRNPADGRFAYGLAHGLGVLAEVDPTPQPDWFWRTIDQRRRARLLYGTAVREAAATAPPQEQPMIISAALVNLADELRSANRWVEAYDVLVAACQIDPANGVAAAGAAELLIWCADHGFGEAPILRARAAEHAERAQTRLAQIERDGGSELAARVARLPTATDSLAVPTVEPDDLYLRWVIKERLALVPAAETAALTPDRFDALSFMMVVPTDQTTMPQTYTMVNALKEDYALARWLAWAGLQSSVIPDTASRVETGDGALFDADIAALRLAQRAALDVLDRVALTLSDHLQLGLDGQAVSFRRLFRIEHAQPRWRQFQEEAEEGNAWIVALVDLASDLAVGGLLSVYGEVRNRSTHRFVIPHQDAAPLPPSSDLIMRLPRTEFLETVLTTLRTARAALMYCMGVIAVREGRLARRVGLL
jgi:hypothetical protein